MKLADMFPFSSPALTADGRLLVRNYKGQLRQVGSKAKRPCDCFALGPTGELLAGIGTEVHLLDPETFKTREVLEMPDPAPAPKTIPMRSRKNWPNVSRICLSPDGKVLAAASVSGEVRLRHLATGQTSTIASTPFSDFKGWLSNDLIAIDQKGDHRGSRLVKIDTQASTELSFDFLEPGPGCALASNAGSTEKTVISERGRTVKKRDFKKNVNNFVHVAGGWVAVDDEGILLISERTLKVIRTHPIRVPIPMGDSLPDFGGSFAANEETLVFIVGGQLECLNLPDLTPSKALTTRDLSALR